MLRHNKAAERFGKINDIKHYTITGDGIHHQHTDEMDVHKIQKEMNSKQHRNYKWILQQNKMNQSGNAHFKYWSDWR